MRQCVLLLPAMLAILLGSPAASSGDFVSFPTGSDSIDGLLEDFVWAPTMDPERNDLRVLEPIPGGDSTESSIASPTAEADVGRRIDQMATPTASETIAIRLAAPRFGKATLQFVELSPNAEPDPMVIGWTVFGLASILVALVRWTAVARLNHA